MSRTARIATVLCLIPSIASGYSAPWLGDRGGATVTIRFLLALLALVVCFKAEAADTAMIYGWGDQSCGAWTKAEVERLPIAANGAMPSRLGSGIPGQTQWVLG